MERIQVRYEFGPSSEIHEGASHICGLVSRLTSVPNSAYFAHLKCIERFQVRYEFGTSLEIHEGASNR